MNKIITAMRDPLISEEIKEISGIEVIGKDIFYKEGILEFLERNSNIQYILIKQVLLDENEVSDFYEKIKTYNNNIKLIIFYNKGEKINKEKQLKNIKYVSNIEEIKTIILEKSKKMLIANERKGEIISILGNGGVGKSAITIEIAKRLAAKGKKVLIVDFDILNSSIHTLLNITRKREYFYYKIGIKIEVLTEVETFFELTGEQGIDNIEKRLEELKMEYDIVLIDTCLYDLWSYLRKIMQVSDRVFFILEPNLLGIKKAKNLLTIFEERWMIDYKKISIILNKETKESIDFEIIKICFSKYKILGKIKQKEEKYLFNGIRKIFYKGEREYEKIVKGIDK